MLKQQRQLHHKLARGGVLPPRRNRQTVKKPISERPWRRLSRMVVAHAGDMRHEHAHPQFPPKRAVGRGRAWYRGDCHVHSLHSNGAVLTPDQIAASARAGGLDFIATTEHNRVDTHGAWGRLAGDGLLVILGQEVTTRSGHWLALGLEPGQLVDWRYGADDEQINRQLRRVQEPGGLCVAAHPHAPYASGPFRYPYSALDVVEVWNGLWTSDLPWQADNETALANWSRNLRAEVLSGSWRPAMGNSDTHLAGQLGIPHSVVLAEELSTDAILAGIRGGRSWVADSAAISLSLSVAAGGSHAGVGERLATGGGPCAVRFEVRGVPSASAALHTQDGPVYRQRLKPDGSAVIKWHTRAAESAFVRVEVRHANGHMAALTNPVLLS